MLRRNGSGTSTSAASDTATVTPLNSTLRPAVPIAMRTASSLSAPAVALLAPAGDDEQRVVDGDAEPDERDEVLHDERRRR